MSWWRRLFGAKKRLRAENKRLRNALGDTGERLKELADALGVPSNGTPDDIMRRVIVTARAMRRRFDSAQERLSEERARICNLDAQRGHAQLQLADANERIRQLEMLVENHRQARKVAEAKVRHYEPLLHPALILDVSPEQVA